MAFVVAGLVLVGALGLVNLLLLTAVIRRLRRQEEERNRPLESGPRPGQELPDFATTTLSGRGISRADLTGRPAVLAFLSTNCPACPALVPHLVAHARSTGLAADRMIVVVVGEVSDAEELTEPLAGVASLVVEPFPGELSAAFRISATPTTVLVDADGIVTHAEAGARPLEDMVAA
ncbi:TlpA family protein disulfide reductase [Streptomyces albipurpureus]|uniref:TlpA family protein disulfide reductase n=1 Tax=Streptomyces albipurpureus TaxID=2897419 RepID=A0ABT0V0C2_9ACTN|nr:TlpA disulfide reductase family protein [Streptomyces sp. CWNU-1]MCM2394185.1 TlpA family protein disulfide reductase [Streptomyces sp. CWNU-1]